MKIKPNFLLREIAGSHIVVPVGQAAVDLQGMITLSGSGALLWEKLQEDRTEQELTRALCEVYDVPADVAAADVTAFVQKLRDNDLIEE